MGLTAERRQQGVTEDKSKIKSEEGREKQMKKNVNFSVVQWLRLSAVNAEVQFNSGQDCDPANPCGMAKLKKTLENDQRLRDLRVQKWSEAQRPEGKYQALQH